MCGRDGAARAPYADPDHLRVSVPEGEGGTGVKRSLSGVAGLLSLALLLAAPASGAPTITTLSEGFAQGQGNLYPSGASKITAGKEGDLWFTQPVASPQAEIGRLAPSGELTEFSAGEQPTDITTGPEGNLWFTQYHSGRIARLTPLGVLSEYSTGVALGTRAITTGSDGNIWFSEIGAIGRLEPTTRAVKMFSKGMPNEAEPEDIISGPKHDLWFTWYGGIGRITLSGRVRLFTKGISAKSGPDQITVGPEGDLWFTEIEANRVARMRPAGKVTEFSAGISVGPEPYGSEPYGIAAGPDGNIWFTQLETDEVASIVPNTGIVTEYHEGIEQRFPSGMTESGGALWFALGGYAADGAIGRISFG